VPEIPVSHVDRAAAYYKEQLGFTIDWGDDGGGGIGGVSNGLTSRAFREMYGNPAPVVIC
jgi:hypothetical protein